jgi:rare lipoprotein A
MTIPAACLSLSLLGLGLVATLAVPAAPQNPDVPPPKVEIAPNGEPVVVHEGEASYYGGAFQGKKTATGEKFDQNKPTAASTELPLGTKATVINKENGRQVDVTVNDRGPYVDGRVIDLSKGAARKLGIIHDGVADVRVEAKPSEQPTEVAKGKVEEKAAKVSQEEPEAGRSGSTGR